MSIDWKGEKLGVLETRRHYSNYFRGIPDFKKYRNIMVTTDRSEELLLLFSDLKKQFNSEPVLN